MYVNLQDACNSSNDFSLRSCLIQSYWPISSGLERWAEQPIGNTAVAQQAWGGEIVHSTEANL